MNFHHFHHGTDRSAWVGRWSVRPVACGWPAVFFRWSIWEWFACQSLAPDCHIMHVYIYIYTYNPFIIYIYSDDNMIIMVPGIDKQTYHCIHILCLSYIHIFIAYIYIYIYIYIYCYLWYDVYNRYSEVNRFKTKPTVFGGCFFLGEGQGDCSMRCKVVKWDYLHFPKVNDNLKQSSGPCMFV